LSIVYSSQAELNYEKSTHYHTNLPWQLGVLDVNSINVTD